MVLRLAAQVEGQVSTGTVYLACGLASVFLWASSFRRLHWPELKNLFLGKPGLNAKVPPSGATLCL